MGNAYDNLSKPDARAAELSFRKNSGGISKEEEEELKRLQEQNAMKRRSANLNSSEPDKT